MHEAMNFLTIIPLVVLTPPYLVSSFIYGFTIRLGVDQETYQKHCEIRNESLRVLMRYFLGDKGDGGKQ